MTKNKEKMSFLQKVSAKREKASLWLGDKENRYTLVPYIIFAFFAILCYVFFCYHDILVTAQHSYPYIDGNIFDYYTASHAIDNNYGSNYLPSTFIIFAIWNIPLKLLSLAPTFFGDWGVIFTLWNKLLPTIFFFASACLMYRLAKDQLDMGATKATFAAMMLLLSPYAFFSQFMFVQYDSFVIFFMLLGMKQYFAKEQTKKTKILFALFFGISATFKYFSAIIYLVLLVLREKKIHKILCNAILFALPLLTEIGFYFVFDRHAFIESVFNFGALSYANAFGYDMGLATVNLVYLALIIVVAFAYFTKPKDDYSLLGWFCFYSCGTCFIFFGLMAWHPQWLLFAVPFWTLSTPINRRWHIFMLIDCAAAIIFNVFISNAFYHQADETLFRYGILSSKLQYNAFSNFSVSDLFMYKNKGMLLTLLVTIFLASFIFKHPRFNMEKPSDAMPHARAWISARFLCGVLTFVIPAFICLPSFLAQDQLLWATYSTDERYGSLTLTTDADDFCQYFKTEGTEITKISIKTHRIPAELGNTAWYNQKIDEMEKHSLDYLEELNARANKDLSDEELEKLEEAKKEEKKERNSLTLELFDPADGRILATVTVYDDDIKDGDFTDFELETPVSISSDTVYGIRISALVSNTIRVGCGSLALPNTEHYRTVTQDYSDSCFNYCGQSSKNVWMIVNIYGSN